MSCAIRPITFSLRAFGSMLAEAEKAESGLFLLRLRDEWLSGAVRFDQPGEALFGAFVDEELVGVGGISLDPYATASGLGRVRHVYVLNSQRGQGIGRLLVKRIIDHARGRFTTLRLTTRSPQAARLYESFGFVRSEAPRQTHRLVL